MDFDFPFYGGYCHLINLKQENHLDKIMNIHDLKENSIIVINVYYFFFKRFQEQVQKLAGVDLISIIK